MVVSFFMIDFRSVLIKLAAGFVSTTTTSIVLTGNKLMSAVVSGVVVVFRIGFSNANDDDDDGE